MGTSKGMGFTCGSLFITAAILVFALQAGCVNYQSVKDFSMGTADFSGSYDSVFSGSYDACLSTAEIRNALLEVGQTPTRSPLTQLSDDEAQCASFNSVTEAFSQTSLGLNDFGRALNLVAIQSGKVSSSGAQFIPQFMGFDENIAQKVPELRDHENDILLVNGWKNYFQSFYIQMTPKQMIIETQPQVDASLNLLTVFSEIYQVQLDNLERNVKVLDTLLYDMQSDDPLKRTFVMNLSREHNRRQQVLNNYNESLDAVKESYKRLYERSELDNPRYSDPIFQQEMKEFLIKITNLVQQSRIVS